MNENNELLLHIYENSNMGMKSTKHILNLIKTKDNKIKSLLETELHGFEEFYKESKSIIKREKIKCVKTNMLTDIMANMTMKKEVDKDNSDSKIADMMIRGFVMGTTHLSKKIKDYEKEIDKDLIKLAKRYLDFQNMQIDKLKEYL